jgi:hypothetical protein
VLEVLGRQDTEIDKAILRGDTDIPATSPEEPTTTPEADDPSGRGGIALPLAEEPDALADEDVQRGAGEDTIVLGQPIAVIRPLLRQMIRWTLLGSRVQGSMFDRLIVIDERLANGGGLDQGDITALEFIHRIAEQHGFKAED